MRILGGAAVACRLWGCAALDRPSPVSDTSFLENESIALALTSLRELEQIDTFIKLDNDHVRKYIEESLVAHAAGTESYGFSKVRVRFLRQVISLEAELLISDGAENQLNVELGGDVILTFSGNQLIWLPHFDRLSVPEGAIEFEGKNFPESSVELEETLLRRVNRDIRDAITILGKSVIQVDALPLGQIEVGATLTSHQDIAASNSQALGGVFTVAGSSILVEPDVTSILADLEFIPNISDCPADLHVSRSTFARQIRSREPRGIIRLLGAGSTEVHFFTEISGATRSSAVVHYWYADGKPVALEELPVEPSYRWRTWSSKSIDASSASNWEVIVVEKHTGCILLSQAIQADPNIASEVQDNTPVVADFALLRREFEQRIQGFSIEDERPEIALIEVPRPFLNDALRASLKDIRIHVDFNLDPLPPRNLTGILKPFNPEEIVCAERECEAGRECVAEIAKCKPQRDTRDCTTCLFRNPLNNRCVNEGTDPICEAARTAQNIRYETQRTECLGREEAIRLDCERRRAQELRSCEIESATELSACEFGLKTVRNSSDRDSFADTSLALRTSGNLGAIFSTFEIEGDLETLKQNLSFNAELELSGTVAFAPSKSLESLAFCMEAWDSSFDIRAVLPQQASSMIGEITTTNSGLFTDWSGYVETASINPTPLESMFVENPNLLADCRIGLTVDKVSSAVSGENSEYLTGKYQLEIKPHSSRINIGMARVRFGETAFEGVPVLSVGYLKYEIQDQEGVQ
jgi:hypothetical protein